MIDTCYKNFGRNPYESYYGNLCKIFLCVGGTHMRGFFLVKNGLTAILSRLVILNCVLEEKYIFLNKSRQLELDSGISR